MVAFLRDRNRVGSGRVGMVELFFDLVFVFAVTQLSHTLLAELVRLAQTIVGALAEPDVRLRCSATS